MKPEDMKKLCTPFPADDIEWRLQSCGITKAGAFWGKVLAYITSRAVQDRLDEVCGPDGWQTNIKKEGEAYLCTLSIRVEHTDGTTEWISRTDGANSTDKEAVKGGISGAIKRAAVHFGIGRYLYNLKENWAEISENGKFSGKTKDNQWFKWNPPALPQWALPGGTHLPQEATKELSKADMEKFNQLKSSAYEILAKKSLPENMLTELEHILIAKDVSRLSKCIDYSKNMLKQQQETIG